MAAPDPVQYMSALQAANQVRLERARTKRAVRSGDMPLVVALIRAETQTMAIGDLLEAQRGWGDVRVRKLLSSMSISPRRRVNQLSLRQRQMIAARVGAVTTKTHTDQAA